MTRRALLAALAAAPVHARPRRLLERSFLQPWRRHLAWSPAQWSELFDWLHALSARQLVLQWTAWNGIDYSSLAASIAGELDRRGMKLWLGLSFADEFWRWPVRPGEDLPLKLKLWRERSLDQASRLASVLARSPAFRGWYLPEEFDAARWRTASAEIARHLSDSRLALARIARKPVAFSGFVSAPPADAAAFWAEALAARAADEFWIQDGIGAGKSTLADWPVWARSVAHAVRRTGSRLSVVVETFEVAPAQEFRASPAPLGRIQRQIDEARLVSQGPLLAFDLAEYMSPTGGGPSSRLGQDYAAASGIRLPAHLLSSPGTIVR